MQIIYGDFPMLIPANAKKSNKNGKIIPIIVFVFISIITSIAVFYFAQTTTIYGKTYYFFCPYTNLTAQETKTVVDRVVNAGGAGITLSEGESISIIASVYDSFEKAQNVAEKNDGKVIEFTISSIALSSNRSISPIKQVYETFNKTISEMIYYLQSCQDYTENEYTVIAFIDQFEQSIKNKEFAYFSNIPVLDTPILQRLRQYATILILEWQSYAKSI